MADQPGFLTATDRAFLRGEVEYDSKQGRYERRRSIRDRTRGAFRDFTRLYTELDETERETIFEPIADGVYHPDAVPNRDAEPPEEYQAAREFREGLFSTFAFIYLGLRPTAISFTNLVEAAVFQTERDHLDYLVDVSLTIEEQTSKHAIENAIAKLEAGAVADLTYTEARLVMEFLLDPNVYPPSNARADAIERLNELDPFSISTDPGGLADTED